LVTYTKTHISLTTKYSKVSWAEHETVMHVEGAHRLGRYRFAQVAPKETMLRYPTCTRGGLWTTFKEMNLKLT